jgi:hypothetical protein
MVMSDTSTVICVHFARYENAVLRSAPSSSCDRNMMSTLLPYYRPLCVVDQVPVVDVVGVTVQV